MSAAEPELTLPRKPGNPIKTLTDEQKQLIFAAVAIGTPKQQVAHNFGIHPGSLSRLLRPVKKAALAMESNPFSNHKLRVKAKSYKAVERALDCKDDPYKAGNIGVKSLIGMGEWQPATQVDERREVIIRWAGGFDPMLDTPSGAVIEASAEVMESETEDDIPT